MNETAQVEVTYISGRSEIITGKRNKDGTLHKLLQKKMALYEEFPTVTSVKILS